jgi:hypothetical protein
MKALNALKATESNLEATVLVFGTLKYFFAANLLMRAKSFQGGYFS